MCPHSSGESAVCVCECVRACVCACACVHVCNTCVCGRVPHVIIIQVLTALVCATAA